MLLSTQTERLAGTFGYEKAIEILAGAGFDAYDLSQFRPTGKDDPFYSGGYLDYAKALRGLSDKLGGDISPFLPQAICEEITARLRRL